jgi:hypothetical protein
MTPVSGAVSPHQVVHQNSPGKEKVPMEQRAVDESRGLFYRVHRVSKYPTSQILEIPQTS